MVIVAVILTITRVVFLPTAAPSASQVASFGLRIMVVCGSPLRTVLLPALTGLATSLWSTALRVVLVGKQAMILFRKLTCVLIRGNGDLWSHDGLSSG